MNPEQVEDSTMVRLLSQYFQGETKMWDIERDKFDSLDDDVGKDAYLFCSFWLDCIHTMVRLLSQYCKGETKIWDIAGDNLTHHCRHPILVGHNI